MSISPNLDKHQENFLGVFFCSLSVDKFFKNLYSFNCQPIKHISLQSKKRGEINDKSTI